MDDTTKAFGEDWKDKVNNIIDYSFIEISSTNASGEDSKSEHVSRNEIELLNYCTAR